jgi:hypothetical protein
MQSRSKKLVSSLRRARARRDQRGAVMFIVVVTLGLLAAMGAYGLSATRADVKASGSMRDALQAQAAGQQAVAMTAESFNPAAVQALVLKMSGDGRTTNCKTAAPYVGPNPAPAAAQCVRLSEDEMKKIALADGISGNPWITTNGNAFSDDAFGPGPLPPAPNPIRPYTTVEVSNPLDVPPPAGSGYDPSKLRFTQVTATVFVNVKDSATSASRSVVVSRGRMTVGPITAPAQKY